MSQPANWGVPRADGGNNFTPVQYAERADDSFDALLTSHIGSSRPTYADAGTLWIDNSSTPWVQKVFDGTDDIPIVKIDITTNKLQWAQFKGADVASASSLTLGSDGNIFDITGTTNVTSINSLGVGTIVKLRVISGFTFVHHAMNLILPGNEDILAPAGDVFEFIEYATGQWFLSSRLREKADIAGQVSFPPGVIFDYVGTTAPTGWLLCNGQDVSRTTYADLFTLIGTTFGPGDGSTTFGIPDYRGRVLAGSDTMGSTAAGRLTTTTMSGNGQAVGETGGSETHTLGITEIPTHNHSGSSLTLSTASDHTHSGTTASQNANHVHQFTGVQSIGNISVGFGSGQNAAANPTQGVFNTGGNSSGHQHSFTTGGAGAHSHNVSGNTGDSGSGGAHNNIPPTSITTKIIKF